MEIALNHQELRYTGRIDMRNPLKPEWIFPATSLQFRFVGKAASVQIRNRCCYWKNRIGVIVDGIQTAYELEDEGMTEIEFLNEEEDAEHEILLFKRMDGCHEIVLEKLELSEGSRLLPLPKLPVRRIEVYGDSVSAGEVSEAIDYAGKTDPEHNGEYSNSWYSYAWMTARKLGAQIHDIAQGGIALLDGTGWFNAPDYIGMETAWDKIHYNPAFGECTEWDFTKYIPQAVIVEIGQNDNHPEDYMKEDYSGERAVRWRQRYKEFIRKIRRTYPEAWIILSTTILNHDEAWDRSIDAICQELGDEKIRHFLYSENGSGTPGHIRIPEADRMSDELAAYMEGLEIEGWD